MATTEPSAVQSAGSPKRKRILVLIAAVIIVLALLYLIWYVLVGSHYESTDDAYVQGNVVQITPQVSGTVVAIKADDTDYVTAGQQLVLLDPADAQVALEQAKAQLAQTVREVRTLYVNNGTLDADILARDADVTKARSELERAQDDYRRRQSLVATGAVSKEEMQHIEATLANAKSQLAAAQAGSSAAKEQLNSNKSLTEGTDVAQHPNVLKAAANVRAAYLALTRSSLPAPVSGQVARRSVQVGQRVQPGTPLMAIVPLDHLWVDANFKEVQLRKMRIGQPVTMVADVYGGKVEYHGKILGLAAGTGGAFSLLPAQNATGNWIKVVQRVPVRIGLDSKDLIQHPLRVGLSVVATVDIANQEGSQLAGVGSADSGYQTQAFMPADDQAEVIVRNTIAANLGNGRLARANAAANASATNAPAAPAAAGPTPAR